MCLVPPLLGDECLRLTSANLELRFPMTLLQRNQLPARLLTKDDIETIAAMTAAGSRGRFDCIVIPVRLLMKNCLWSQ